VEVQRTGGRVVVATAGVAEVDGLDKGTDTHSAAPPADLENRRLPMDDVPQEPEGVGPASATEVDEESRTEAPCGLHQASPVVVDRDGGELQRDDDRVD
jgi:hypothetical protein